MDASLRPYVPSFYAPDWRGGGSRSEGMSESEPRKAGKLMHAPHHKKNTIFISNISITFL